MKKAQIITVAAPSAKVEPTRIVDGFIVVNANDATQGSIMVENITKANVLTGMVDDVKRVFFFRGTVVKLQAWVKETGLAVGADISAKIQPLRIVVEERQTPFYTRANGSPQEPKINPKSGKVLLSNGLPIYRNTILTPADSVVEDILIKHTAESADGLAEFMAASKTATMPS